MSASKHLVKGLRGPSYDRGKGPRKENNNFRKENAIYMSVTQTRMIENGVFLKAFFQCKNNVSGEK